MSRYVPDLITLYKELLSFDLDDRTSGDQSPSDAQVILKLNEAKDLISKRILQYDPSITLTLSASVSTYGLRDPNVFSRRVIKPYRIIINNVTLRGASGGSGLFSITDLEGKYPSWRTATAGTPFLAAYVGNQQMVLYPPPTAAVVAAGNNYLAGQYLAKDLVAPTTVTSGATSATQTVGSTSGMAAGDVLYFATAAVERTVSSVTNATTVVLTASVASTTSEVVSIVPDLPDELRPAISYLAAIKGAEPSASEQQQFARLDRYGSNVMDLLVSIERENRNALVDAAMLGRDAPTMMTL